VEKTVSQAKNSFIKKAFSSLIGVFFCFGISTSANAALIKWQVDYENSDGIIVVGSFIFDSLTSSFSSIDLNATTPGAAGIFTAANFTAYSSTINSGSFVTDDEMFFVDIFINAVSELAFLGTPGSLTNQPQFSFGFLAGNVGGSQYSLPSDISDSTLVGRLVDVPEPSAVAILALGILGMSMRRKARS
jgi:hypothetical protein